MRRGHWLLLTASAAALASAAGAAVTVAGGGFETPEVGAGYAYAPTGSPASFSGNSGVAGNGSAWGFAPAPEGDQVAFLQTIAAPAAISLNVAGLTPGASYTASFSLAARPGFEANPVTVSFDGTPLGTFSPASPAFAATTSAPFTATASSGTLTFTGVNLSADRSTGLDNVTVAAAGGETVTYSYDALGRLTGTSTASGPNNGSTSAVGYDAAGNRSVYASSVTGPPAFSVSEAAAAEGGGLVFTVVKNGTGAASVSYGTAAGTAAGGVDFHGASGGLNFAAGESSKTVAVATIDDSSDELSETLSLNLSGPSAGSTIADGQGIGTIFDDDEPPPPLPPPPPVFSIGDSSAAEGGALVFTVTKTGATVSVFGVGFATANNTASANALGGPYVDYHAAAGNLYFMPGESSKTIIVQGSDDPLDESNETFFLSLSTLPGGATISDSQGVGTIVDNDDPPPPPPPGNTPPTAVNDAGTMLRCSSKTFNVLENDSDPDGAIDLPLSVVAVAGNGFSFTSTAVTVESQYLSSGDYGYYTVRDARGAQSTATLTITLNGGGNCSD